MQLKSDFAILDVKRGRKALIKKVGISTNGKTTRVPVIITGFIDSAWGRDDGISQEFEVSVTKVECGESSDAE